MDLPEELKYSKEHEWIRVEGDEAIIGITEYAQDQLGEIVFVELPAGDDEFGQGDALGVVESVKSVSDIYAPVNCQVLESNAPLVENPEMVNDDPYGEGWFVKVKISDKSQLDALLDAAGYEAYLREESE